MKKKWLVSIPLLLLIGLLAVWSWNTAKTAYHLMGLRSEIKAVIGGDPDNIEPLYVFSLLNSVNQDLYVLQRNLTPIYPILPIFGRMAAQVEPALTYLDSLVNFALLYEPKIRPLFNEGLQNHVDLANLIDSFSEKEFVSQIDRIGRDVEEHRQRLDILKLPYRFQDDFKLLDKYLPFINLSREILPQLGSLTGADKKTDYLLLALNHDELRGGGGFITAIGMLSVQNLTNISIDLQDSYSFDDLSKDYPLPPLPLQTYMLADYWLPRDGNWSADFPESARTVQMLYQISRNEKMKGVIAFDQEAVRQIVAAVGPIQVDPQSNTWVNQDNILNYMQESWGSNVDSSDWWRNRKDFISILGKVIVQSVMDSRDINQVTRLARTSLNLLKQGHLMLYFNDPKLESVLASQGFDHGVSYQGGDLIYWVDSNIGFNKVDAVIERELKYTIDLRDPKQANADLIMQFTHQNQSSIPCEHIATYGEEIAYQKMMERCYWDYWRVYLPPGSQLIDYESAIVPGENLLNSQTWEGQLDQLSDLMDLSMIGGLLMLPTASQQKIRLTYQLPDGIVIFKGTKGYYHLDLKKQLGLNALPVEITVKIPNDYQFVDYPADSQINQNSLVYKFLFTGSDDHLIISYQP